MTKYLKSGLYYDAYIKPIIADELARLADVRRYDWLTVAKDKGAYHDAVDACGNAITDEAPLDVLRYANDKNASYCYDVIVAGRAATMYKEMIVYDNLNVAEVASSMALAGLVDDLPDEIPAVDDSDDPDDNTITTAELEALEQKAVEVVAFALDIDNNSVDYDDDTVLEQIVRMYNAMKAARRWRKKEMIPVFQVSFIGSHRKLSVNKDNVLLGS